MKEINVEEIMEEIRSDIARRGLVEDDLNFQKIINESNLATAFDNERLQNELSMLNASVCFDLNPKIVGNGLKSFIKRAVRKCMRFYVQPLFEHQIEFNLHAVRVLNELNLNIKEREKENEELKKKIEDLENGIQ